MTDAPRRRVLAVDHGERRTGLAATDYTGSIVVPLEPLHESDAASCARAIAALATERRSEVIVVGLPLDVEGGIGHHARRVLQFVEVLRQVAPCPVATVDETFSTDEAHERLAQAGLKAAQRRKLADSIAAVVILERWRHGG